MDKLVTEVRGAPGFTITRHHVGYHYTKSGNLHNPTPRYSYTLELDGKLVDSSEKKKVLINEAKDPKARSRYSD